MDILLLLMLSQLEISDTVCIPPFLINVSTRNCRTVSSPSFVFPLMLKDFSICSRFHKKMFVFSAMSSLAISLLCVVDIA